MALVQASDTANLRSSIRSSARSRLDEASEETTSRARETYSGRAGMSSSTSASSHPSGRTASPCATTLGGGGRFNGVVDREHLRETGDLEHLQDAGLGADQDHVPVMAPQALEPSDEHAQTGGVEEVHALQVDHHLMAALADQLDEPLTEPG